MVNNKALMYKNVPDGMLQVDRDLAVESTDFDIDAAPPVGGFTTKNLYATFDPAQRSAMRDPSIKSYNKAMEPGKPLNAVTVIARVLKSDTERFTAGDIVLLITSSTEEYTTVPSTKLSMVQALTPSDGIPLTAYVSVFGMTGLTAYGGLYEIGQPKRGETILVSAAAGAVGQIVGQLAVREGLKVIGSVGDDRKLDFIIKELGYTSGFNYKKEKPADAIQRLAPEGLDIYFDNVGGELLDAALAQMKDFGRIVACGTVSTYNDKPGEGYGIQNYKWINRKRLRYQGFIVMDKNISKHQEKLNEDLTNWIRDGSFKSVEHVIEGGIDAGIDGFLGMFKGENMGRTILKIAEP